jgi:RNA polymerase-binding transcription factor DksA
LLAPRAVAIGRGEAGGAADFAVLDGHFGVGYREQSVGPHDRHHEDQGELADAERREAMTKADLERYHTTLLGLRKRMTGDVSHLADEALRARGGEASGSLSNAPLHPADLGTDNYEQEFTFSLLQTQEQTLTEIAEALERIKQGTFGRCEECGDAIARARLQALPFARHCVACARKLQS